MSAKSMLQALLTHRRWAMARIFDAAARVSDAQYRAQRSSPRTASRPITSTSSSRPTCSSRSPLNHRTGAPCGHFLWAPLTSVQGPSLGTQAPLLWQYDFR